MVLPSINNAQMVRDMTDALLVRAGQPVQGEGFRNFGDGDLREMARRVLESGGVNTRTLSRLEIATRALNTGDFASALSAVGDKLARAGYSAMPMAHRTCFRKTTASDFRNKNRVVVSAGQRLEQVPENGRIERRTAKFEMASYALKSYGGIIPITRQLVIDDDYDMFASLSRERGRAAAETERDVTWDFVKSNPTAPVGQVTFHADHGNTDSAAVNATVDLDKLSNAREVLRTAKAPDGRSIGATVRYIVSGPTTETAWEKLLSPLYVPTSAAAVVPASLRSVTPLVESSITDDGWFAFADYNQVDTFEYSYLTGAEGPRLESRMGFEVDGIELKVCLDYAIGIIDHRGCYRMTQS